jgi:hypothetical protein
MKALSSEDVTIVGEISFQRSGVISQRQEEMVVTVGLFQR